MKFAKFDAYNISDIKCIKRSQRVVKYGGDVICSFFSLCIHIISMQTIPLSSEHYAQTLKIVFVRIYVFVEV